MDKAVTYKKDWVLTEQAFKTLLRWLDADPERAGLKYEELRRRLVSYFNRKRCLAPEELADETLNRVARRIVEDEQLINEEPTVYCYRVARLVFMEDWRDPARLQESIDELTPSKQPFVAPTLIAEEDEQHLSERRLECLGHCIRQLPQEKQLLIGEYYQGERRAKIDRREALAARLKISLTALRIRAYRIREKLEACVSKCLSNG